MNKQVTIIVLLTAIFLGGTLWVSYSSVDNLDKNQEWVTHTHEVVNSVKDVLASLVDAETGQRGYIITGNESYLEPYYSAVKDLASRVKKAKELTQDNPEQQADFHKLELAVQTRLDELTKNLKLRKEGGFEAASHSIGENRGKKVMDEIRAILAGMESREEALLQTRLAATTQSVERAHVAAIVSAAVGVLLLLLSLQLMRQHLAERALRERVVSEQKELFRVTLASIGDAVMTTDMNSRITFLNPVAEQLTGWKLRDALGKHVDDVFVIVNEHTRLKAENPINEVFRTGAIRGLANHTALIAKEGKEVSIDDSAAPIRHADNSILGVVLVFRDITAKKADQEALRKAMNEARRANRTKDEFLAIVSHELRTPLTAMLGWIRMIQNSPLTPAQVDKGLAVIERNISVQSQLIEDLLDISRITSGKMKMNPRPLSLETVINAAIESVRPAAEAKGIQIVAELRPIWINADADRLQQVVWNLLTNAIKFSQRKSQVNVRLAQADSQVRIIVSDTGKGIAREFLPRLFDLFSQEDSSSTRALGGLGLGLAIVRHLVEQHGGQVHAESEGEGKGTIFTVTLPVPVFLDPAQNKGSEASSAPRSLQGKRVLIVDDESDTRELIAMIVEQHRGIPRQAPSAADAIAALDTFVPDVLLSDIGMPGMDGCALIQKIRGSHAPVIRNVPAIALTAYARDDDRFRALEAGFNYYEAKPIEPRRLIEVICTTAKV